MFNKNTQQSYHKALANSFNRKKIKANDIKRFENIHTKINQLVKLDIEKEKNGDICNIPITDVFKMNDIKISTTIHLSMKNNDDNVVVPKIVLKDIVIPTYYENDNYDINTINNSITTKIKANIQMNINNLNPNFDKDNIIYNVKTIDNSNSDVDIIADTYTLESKKVKIINNVYQESYSENVKPSGFGDFIRGCYFLLQFCSINNFQCKVIINHPISFFLKKFYQVFILHNNLNKEIFKDIPMFTENNFEKNVLNDNNYIIKAVNKNEIEVLADFINYLSKLKVNSGNLFSYNIMFPYHVVKEDHKIYMRDLLEPNEEMTLYVDNTLKAMGFRKKSYSIIHLRSGDNYLNDDNTKTDNGYFKKIVGELSALVNYNPSVNYLLISDNNDIKVLLAEKFPSFKMLFKNITHLGEGTILEREKVKNTLLDFYIMSHSNSIHAYTCYAHGTGFSYWCAKTYNVPYKCMYIAG
jgi:hypothetical protein